MVHIEDDLAVLEQPSQDELLNDFHSRFGRLRRLKREVDRLRAQVDDESN